MRTTKALFLTATFAILVAGIAGIAGAQANPPETFGTPDGLPPSLEEVCDMTTGAAHGLCVAFCEAMDCETDEPQASERACTRVGDRFVQITGELPPCLRSCPCWEPEDLNSITADNQLPFNSCNTSFFATVIQNDGFTGVEGGFATDSGLCLTRDLPPFGIAVTPEEFETCTAQIAARCEEIGTPIGTPADNGGGDDDGGEAPPPP